MSSKFEKIVDSAIQCVPVQYRHDNAARIAWLRSNEEVVLHQLFTKTNRRISCRTKILAFCIAAQHGVRETNALLRAHGAEMLYARNLPDIAIMRGLELQYNAAELCALMREVQPLSLELPSDANQFFLRDGRFCCTIERMEAYLDASRVPSENPDERMTRALTTELQSAFNDLLEEEADDAAFLAMLKKNISMFSEIRERTRREFVRYLCRWTHFVAQKGDKSETEIFFMNVDARTRPEKWKINLSQLVTDVDEEMYQQYLLDPQQTFENPLYEIQKCAKLIRKFILGETDISRTLFTSFLLFLIRNTGDGMLDSLQINAVLDKCGFKLIDVCGDNAFDRLVLDIIDNQHLPQQEFQEILLFDLDDPDELVFECYEGEDYTMSRSTATANALTR